MIAITLFLKNVYLEFIKMTFIKYLKIIIASVLLVGCVDSEQLGNSLQTNSVETVAEIEKTQLTIERVVGEFKMAFSTLIFDKNGTCKAMRGDNVIGSGTSVSYTHLTLPTKRIV